MTNKKTANLQNSEHKIAKQQNSKITNQRKTKQRPTQNSERYKRRANYCEKRRIDHTEYGQFSFRSIRCFSRIKNVNSPFC